MELGSKDWFSCNTVAGMERVEEEHISLPYSQLGAISVYEKNLTFAGWPSGLRSVCKMSLHVYWIIVLMSVIILNVLVLYQVFLKGLLFKIYSGSNLCFFIVSALFGS